MLRWFLNTAIMLSLLTGIAVPVFAQLSPGDLAEVHAHLEGTSNCTKCHTIGDKVTNDKCLDCHKEIKVRLEAGKGYHASEEVKGKYCYLCHNDHHGRKFQIIHFDADTFNHNLTQYKLEGAHASATCEDCHKKEYITDTELPEKEMTYLGLSQECMNCHEDVHQGTLPADCRQCHSFEYFSPAVNFNHNTTDFPLKGRHQGLDCELCHKNIQAGNKNSIVFSGVKHLKCTDCHEDPHNNRFGQNCTDCHSEESFHLVKNMSSFNHNSTDFPLLGKHQLVDCQQCHKGSYSVPIAHNQCMDCHDDYHDGQIGEGGMIPDCAECHNVDGFSGSSFTIERHQSTSFPLEGAHMAIPCFLCHQKDKEERWQFDNIGEYCYDCHEDIHDTYIDAKYYPDKDCRKCHAVSRWNEVEFDHVETGYILHGAHKEVECRACHFDENVEGGFVQKFQSLNDECLQCHNDVHYNQFEIEGSVDCLRCHLYDNWEAVNFNHDNTDFKLEGRHAEIECSACHKEIVEENLTYVLYKIEDYRCEACH